MVSGWFAMSFLCQAQLRLCYVKVEGSKNKEDNNNNSKKKQDGAEVCSSLFQVYSASD